MGRRLRVKTDGTQIHKIHLKEDDRATVERKLGALAFLYKKLTNKNLTFEFVKTETEEKKKKKEKKGKRGDRKEDKKIERKEGKPAVDEKKA